MTINSSVLFQVYEQTLKFVQGHQFEASKFQAIQTMFEDKRQKADAHIIVYGVYNAGKSTLINALLGEYQAKVDDVPTTDIVSAYRWRQYDILDTPGVDAPIVHQKITDQEMLKADAVIFVVNPIGVAEESATLLKLLELVKARKQVFLVFNEKQVLSVDDFQKLKNQTQARLQELAVRSGLKDVLKDIPIVRVNAQSALKGKLENKLNLLERSGFPLFEKRLIEFLQGVSPDTMYERLKVSLTAFLSECLHMLQARSQVDVVKKYDELLKHMERNKDHVRRRVRQAIANERGNVASKVKARLQKLMSDEQQNCVPEIENYVQQIFEDGVEKVNDVLQIELLALMQQLQLDIEDLQAQVQYDASLIGSLNVQNMGGSLVGDEAMQQLGKSSQISQAALAASVGELAKMVKPEHIVASLQLVKSTFPSLLEGIGIKTMEKWAEAIVSKIPYIGPFISGALALADIFFGDSENEQYQRQADAYNRQRERALQQITDAAEDMGSQFENMLREQIEKIIDEIFANVAQQLHALRQGFSDEERKNSEWIEQLSRYHAEASHA